MQKQNLSILLSQNLENSLHTLEILWISATKTAY